VLEITWDILSEAAFFLLVGFAVAGLLHGVLARWDFARYLRRRGPRGVLLATLVGMPLPLCSCSVLPTALTLRRNGASRGSTLAFLVSTPETSVPSILLTYALLGPVMAVVRPVAACVSSIAAGLAGDVATRREAHEAEVDAPTCGDCSCGAAGDGATSKTTSSTRDDVARGFRFAFVTLFDDVFGWILVGILAAAAIRIFVPPELLMTLLGGPLQSLVVMALVGVPLYVCAEASTPIAAVFIAQGVSPGAALVFLLVGPATNLGSIGVLTRALGRRAIVAYLAMVVVVAIASGFLLDAAAVDLASRVVLHAEHGSGLPAWLSSGAAVLFLLLGIGSARRRRWGARSIARLLARARRLWPTRVA
jgi:uncharacterized membrane protein YraQ (UPF0718 family)